MTDTQKKLLILLKEIKKICDDNQIEYYLGWETALAAYRSQHFESKTNTVHVVMTLANAIKFHRLVKENTKQNRYLDGIFDNEYFPNVSMRYNDTQTLHIDLNRYPAFKAYGLSVNISILRKVSHSKIRRRILLFWEMGWLLNNPEGIAKFHHWTYRFLRKCTSIPLKFCRKIYRDFLLKEILSLQYTEEADERFFLKLDGRRNITFKKALFSEKQMILFENIEFPLPLHAEQYLKKLYGSTWLTHPLTSTGVDGSNIVSPYVPYTEYLERLAEEGISHLYVAERTAYFKAKCIFNIHNRVIQNAWFIVCRTGSRFKMWQLYMNQKETIQRLEANEEWEQLGQVFQEYNTAVESNYAHKLGLCFDPEIFDIYCYYLEKKGRKKFAKKIRKLVPIQHYQPLEIK